MLPEGTTRKQYLDAFDRRNLLRTRAWDQRKAREVAQALLPDLDGRFIVVLGTQVRAALGLPLAEPLSINCVKAGASSLGWLKFKWVAMPHPSGRNRWFNEPGNLKKARAVLADLMRVELAP